MLDTRCLVSSIPLCDSPCLCASVVLLTSAPVRFFNTFAQKCAEFQQSLSYSCKHIASRSDLRFQNEVDTATVISDFWSLRNVVTEYSAFQLRHLRISGTYLAGQNVGFTILKLARR